MRGETGFEVVAVSGMGIQSMRIWRLVNNKALNTQEIRLRISWPTAIMENVKS